MMEPLFKILIDHLTDCLKQPLPGFQAQRIMAPPNRLPGDAYDLEALNAKNACVLILLYPHQNKVYLPLILRSVYEGVHSAQIGFPGGKPEGDDRSFLATALRETHEEIGIKSETINILGNLTPLYIPPSNFLVHPFIGYVNRHPRFKIDPKEVQQLYEIDLEELRDSKNIKSKFFIHKSSGTEVLTPYYDIQQQTIWGATAMILSELVALLNKN